MTFWNPRPKEPPPLELRFTPQLDITVYELAVICGLMAHLPLAPAGHPLRPPQSDNKSVKC